MEKVCKNCLHWKRMVVSSYCLHYSEAVEEYTSYDVVSPESIYAPWTEPKEKKRCPDLPQRIGTCSCEKFIYDAPETPDPRKISDQISDALYHRDYEGLKSFFRTGENFGCIHFKGRES